MYIELMVRDSRHAVIHAMKHVKDILKTKKHAVCHNIITHSLLAEIISYSFICPKRSTFVLINPYLN